MSHRASIFTRRTLILSLGILLAAPPHGARAQDKSTEAAELKENIETRKGWMEWNQPFKPFHIIGNIYYVGVQGVSSFLIVTPQGNILLDTGFEETVPHITDSIKQLGFKLEDIKIILNSHAHLDHCGGDALMKSLTGAKIMMSAADAEILYTGGVADYTPYLVEMKSFPPAKADRLVGEGDQVTLDGTTLTCHLTPGHTKGCVAWTMTVKDGGKEYHVVFYGSTSLLSEVRVLNNPKYPNIVADYTASFAKLKTLPCDVFLAPHALFFDLAEKRSASNAAKNRIRSLIPMAIAAVSRLPRKSFKPPWKKKRRKP